MYLQIPRQGVTIRYAAESEIIKEFNSIKELFNK